MFCAHCKILQDCRSFGNLGWARANVAAATRALLGLTSAHISSHQLCPQLTSALPVDQLQKKCEILRLFSWSWNREICRIFTVHQRDRRNSSVGIVELLYCFFMYPLASLIYMIYIFYISKLRPKKCPRQAEGDKKLKISEQHPFLSHVFCCRCFMSLGAGWSKVKTLLNYARIEGVQKKRSW